MPPAAIYRGHREAAFHLPIHRSVSNIPIHIERLELLLH